MSLSRKRGNLLDRKARYKLEEGISEVYMMNCGFNFCPFLEILQSVTERRMGVSREMEIAGEIENLTRESMHKQIVYDAFSMMEMQYPKPGNRNEESMLARLGMHVVKNPMYSTQS